MTFLYPKAREYTFDEVCEQIVRELEARSWKVPGIAVSFESYGNGWTYVGTIQGADFKLYFCREQGSLDRGHWNDIAAVYILDIPEKELHVFGDNSGPRFYLYVGNNWEQDRPRFIKTKVLSKLHGEPRIYLMYEGECRCPASDFRHTHPSLKSPYLAHNNSLGREYDPEGEEPKEFITAEVEKEFADWLTEHVLTPIQEDRSASNFDQVQSV